MEYVICIQQSLLINIFIEEIKIVEMRGYCQQEDSSSFFNLRNANWSLRLPTNRDFNFPGRGTSRNVFNQFLLTTIVNYIYFYSSTHFS